MLLQLDFYDSYRRPIHLLPINVAVEAARSRLEAQAHLTAAADLRGDQNSYAHGKLFHFLPARSDLKALYKQTTLNQ